MAVHTHWTIFAYQNKIENPKDQIPLYGAYRMDDGLNVKVDADTEDEALEKAKQTIKRNFYRVSEVFACEQDHEMQEEMKIRQLAIQEKMLKEFMGMKNG